jgi:hypothetical protein
MKNLNKSVKRKMISKLPSFYILLKNDNDLKTTLINIKGFKAIKKKYLFDLNYYLKNNPDVESSNLDPLLHYIYHGYNEGRDPNPTFNNNNYLKKYKDVSNKNLNPLVHYSLYGINEKKWPTNCTNLFKKAFKHLNKTLKGQKGYLFLINDRNNELRQHFDENYKNKFDPEIFLSDLSFKKNFCREKNINYFFFLVPDKSLVCKEFLPFPSKTIKRNYNLLKPHIPDFITKLDPTCYFENDSHVNYLGAKKLVYNYLNYIDKDFSQKDFDKLMDEQISVLELKVNGDLTEKANWSYSDDEKTEHINKKVTVFRNELLTNLSENIPKRFKYCGERKTEYYENKSSFKDLRVLIFRESSLIYLKDVLSIYFKEILLYWDHWYFNREIIEWYKPDVILEIRTERFLENYQHMKK